MSGWLYLIRNRDLYKIGITKNFHNRMRQLKPDNVVAKIYSKDFLKLERELHKRYKKFRIPQTEYFRLENNEVKEIKQRISRLDFPTGIIFGIFIKSFLLLLFIYVVVVIIISLNINDENIVIFKSLRLMERISFGLSILALITHSGKYLSFFNEVKYRLCKLIILTLFAVIFRFAYMY